MVADAPAATVLVVDDDQGLVRLVRKTLRREGYRVMSAISGQGTIAWLTHNHADLMLLDSQLHDIEGKELIRHLDRIKRSIPFIAMSGQGDKTIALEMMKRGAMACLVKDVDFLRFVPEAVRRALQHLENRNRLAEVAAALSESEARFRFTADHAPVLIWMTGADQLRTWFNRPWLEFTGRSMEQQLGIGWIKSVHRDDRHKLLLTYIKSFTARKPFVAEYRLLRHDGEWRWVFDNASPVYGPGSQFRGFIGSCVDITERKQIEQRLKLQRDTALALAEAFSPLEAGLKILQAVCQAFDWDYGELWRVDKTANLLRNLCAWPPRDKASAGWGKATEQLTFTPGTGVPGRVWTSRQTVCVADLAMDASFPRRDLARHAHLRRGFAFPVLLGNEVVGVMAFFGRETCAPDEALLEFFRSLGSQIGQFMERKRAEEALRLSEANLASAQQIAHVGSYEINLAGRDGNHWSVESLRIVGLDPASTQLTPSEFISRIVHPDDQARVRETFGRSTNKRVPFTLEYRTVRPDGSIRHVHSTGEPVLDAENKVVKLVGALQDVTERKQLEKEVREISEREQRRIGRDLHDGLGQQLTAIELLCHSLRSDLASARPELEEQAAQVCRLLSQAVGQTRTLAHGLVAFKVETGGLQTALMGLAQATSSLGRVNCQFRCPSPVVLNDGEAATHLYRIAQEAVNNAVRHSRGSKITIQLSDRNGVLRLQVRDNGKGLPRIKKSSFGMGLRLMKHRASVVGAELRVRSQVDKGVTVTCTLRRKQ